MPPSDAELMEQFGNGDDEAFRTLVERHEAGLLQFFYRRCWDRSLAEDCVQEVFLRLVRHRGTWRPDAKFTTYLYRIAENHWIDRWRSKKAAPKESSLEGSTQDEDAHADIAVSPERLPEETASDHELARKIRKALSRIPEEQQAVFTMAEAQGMKYADIAEALGVPVGTVKSRMHAATTRMRELLQEDGVEL